MDFQPLVKKTGFNLSWQRNDQDDTKLTNDFRQMRDWQVDAFECLKESTFMILNAPMGSGKSWLMCLLSAFKMERDKSIRTIIIVPQTIIAQGFLEANMQMPNGDKMLWRIKHNLCADGVKMGTVNYFMKWLESSSAVFQERAIICTHATLISVYKKLKKENRLNLLKNILLWIDEAHHIKNVEAEDLANIVISNAMGELVSYFLVNAHKSNLQIGLTTASYFRGDRASLLTNNMEENFKRFNLPYDKYFRSMKHLRSFSFDFLLTGYEYVKGLRLLIQTKRAKDIIYIPHPVSQYSTGDKLKEVSDIISAYGQITQITQDGLIVVQGDYDELRVLDLVSEKDRKQKKSYLDNPLINKEHDSLDSIVALGMFKEGANWIYADRCIIVGARTSLVDVIQMVGRLFRDAPNKAHVEIIQILPFSLDQQNEQMFRENLNNYLKAIYASLILENILNPVKIKSTQKINKEKPEKFEDSERINWLNIALPDDAKQQTLLEEVGNRLVEVIDQNKQMLNDTRLLYDKYNKIIPEILEDFGITEHTQEVAKQIWATLARRSMQMQGISVEDIDFNIIQDANPLDFLLRYTSGICDVNTFEKLRAAIQLSRIAWRSFKEAREFVHQLDLKSETDWRKYIKGDIKHLASLPNDIPKAPWVAYANDGWCGWGDFLGTNTIAPRFRKYRAYKEACEFVHALNLKRKEDWVLYTKGGFKYLPPLLSDIPASPSRTYKRPENGACWVSWADFLGSGIVSPMNKSKMWRSYEDAQSFVVTLGLKTAMDWRKYLKGAFPLLEKLPSNIPRKPNEIYKDQWKGWASFFGSDTISKFNCKRDFLSFIEARRFVHSLELKNQREWVAYCAGRLTHLPKKPLEIPSNPEKKYKNSGWVNLADWLGL